MSIRVKQVSKNFGTQKALDEVSFEVSAGELVGFLGPNGAGKSTLMKIMTGYLASDGGSVEINGEVVGQNNIGIRSQIGYLPENNPLYGELYVREYLEMVAGFYQLQKKKELVEKMIELTGLQAERHKKIGMLSKGYRQRVGLAQALIHDPAVLILDEPTTGLDPNQLDEIRQLVRTISTNKTVLLSTHIMQEVEAICSRVIIINKGKLTADGSIFELKSGRFKRKQTVLVEFNQVPVAKTLMEVDGIGSAEMINSTTFLIEANSNIDVRPAIFQYAIANRLVLLTVQQQQQSLEQVFQDLTR
jgi:ABC-2 type transport system ATP-binding protein